MKQNLEYEKRKYVIMAAAVFLVAVFIARLVVLQLMTDEYKAYADSNAFLHSMQYPARGAIYDRNGELVVFDEPSYDINFIPNEVTELDTLDFCNALNITKEQFLKRMEEVKDRRKNPGYSKYTQQVFMTQLSQEETLSIIQRIRC